ncbi:hypothetical protein V5799_005285 [Amblyomma americanum]|uniref:Uncharacterized protein n=1 Tax=Amblyomma americanum TaxID=6943 RepID=A0AAQ4DZQ0_AMBAM
MMHEVVVDFVVDIYTLYNFYLDAEGSMRNASVSHLVGQLCICDGQARSRVSRYSTLDRPEAVRFQDEESKKLSVILVVLWEQYLEAVVGHQELRFVLYEPLQRARTARLCEGYLILNKNAEAVYYDGVVEGRHLSPGRRGRAGFGALADGGQHGAAGAQHPPGERGVQLPPTAPSHLLPVPATVSSLAASGTFRTLPQRQLGLLQNLRHPERHACHNTFLDVLTNICIRRHAGLTHFKNIVLLGASDDYVVPLHSAHIKLVRHITKDTTPLGAAYREMLRNILKPIMDKPDMNLIRLEVHVPFRASLISSNVHVAPLGCEILVQKIATVACARHLF